MLDAALSTVKSLKIMAFIDARELDGWEPRAAWDDFRLGLKYGNEFVKIAILGNKKWQQLAAKVSAWFMSGEVRYFDSLDEALSWLDA